MTFTNHRYVVKRHEPWWRVHDTLTGCPKGRHFETYGAARVLADRLNASEKART